MQGGGRINFRVAIRSECTLLRHARIVNMEKWSWRRNGKMLNVNMVKRASQDTKHCCEWVIVAPIHMPKYPTMCYLPPGGKSNVHKFWKFNIKSSHVPNRYQQYDCGFVCAQTQIQFCKGTSSVCNVCRSYTTLNRTYGCVCVCVNIR